MLIHDICEQWLTTATSEELKIKGPKYKSRVEVTYWLWAQVPVRCREEIQINALSGASNKYIIPLGLAEALANDKGLEVEFFGTIDRRR